MFTAVTEQSDRDNVLHDGDESGAEALGLRIELPQRLSDGRAVDALFDAFVTDNPQFFYIGSRYTYEGYRVGERAQYTALSLTMTMNAAERRAAAAKLESAVAELTEGLSDREPFGQEVLLHDRLIARCRYDQTAADSADPDREYPFAFTAYGALVEGKAVCEGYARAFSLLCRRVGIPCTTVNGVDLSTKTALYVESGHIRRRAVSCGCDMGRPRGYACPPVSQSDGGGDLPHPSAGRRQPRRRCGGDKSGVLPRDRAVSGAV